MRLAKYFYQPCRSIRAYRRAYLVVSFMVFISQLISFPADADPRPLSMELPLHLRLLSGEAELRHTHSRRLSQWQKPVGEQTESFDIDEVTLVFEASPSLPSGVRAEFTFRAIADGLEDVSIFILGVSAEQVSAQISYDTPSLALRRWTL